MMTQDKVTKYEEFLNDVLRVDLKTTLDRRDDLYNQISQYMELQTILEKIPGDHSLKLKTRVDIGSNFYVQAEIPNTRMITVDIGCGIWLLMSPPDAINFSQKKLNALTTKAEELTAKELGIKAQIKLVLEGLREIQRIGNE